MRNAGRDMRPIEYGWQAAEYGLELWKTSRNIERSGEERAMSMILIFTGKWNRWYRVLRYGHGFGLLDSVRYGLWLARG